MSSRQMRRLQDLVDRATGLDADDFDDDAVPRTMQVRKSDHHRQRKKSKKTESAAPHVPGTDILAGPPTLSSSTSERPKKGKIDANEAAPSAPAPPPSTSVTTDDWKEVSEDEDHTNGSTARRNSKKTPMEDAAARAEETAAAAEDAKKRRRAEKKKSRRQQQRQRQAEEEALLDAVLARRQNEQVDPASSSGVGSPVAEHHPGGGSVLVAASSTGTGPSTGGAVTGGGAGETSFLQLVMACDAHQLDTRLERIRMFGAEAVEDVGDGRTPHRRADGRVRDTGSVSFFPAHHMTVKFVHSAFATPNRYRWIPYDSLGIFLTTEEAHDVWGQVWRAYLLVCSSHAFQRAQASLEACQERLGGVQDLVDCLARNRVYHIPTLLQCVYAMEATGESAFAMELLDVALYQVGVVLRRFALSGTWVSRQLPCHRSANTLIFQVLQRGVHAALKRGCLRTAYERTRCLLSLDPDDPCGMLLLLDYTALRAKRWVWLLEVRHRALAVRAARRQPRRGAAAESEEADVKEALAAAGLTLRDATLAEDVLCLPNYAFSWALAKHFIEREEARQRSDEVSGGACRPSKVLRGLTDAQRASLAATPSAVELLSAAVLRFPQAAVRLVDALGGVDVVCGTEGATLSSSSQASAWQQLMWQADGHPDSAADAAVHNRLADLFVARHEELWKLSECISLLRHVVRRMLSEPATGVRAADSGDSSEENANELSSVTCVGQSRYRNITRDSVMGASVAPIPADLLEPDAAELAMAQEAAALGLGAGEDGAQPATVQRVMQMLRGNLETFGENEYVRNLLYEVRREFQDRIWGGAREGSGDDEAGGEQRDWYDVDGSEDKEEQEWYSVASGGSEDADDDAAPGDGDEVGEAARQ
ncbi:Transcriptional repressor TCF25, putative [Leishmania donovani]|uniref:Transcriptional repressor TCF25, putative n=1 Tax=Leishmania donovani TaxID=5661 RepID=A0A3S5H5E5_LEIDO|nr:Transcriptional repressor TCF25, putative [Leishmania donovani]